MSSLKPMLAYTGSMEIFQGLLQKGFTLGASVKLDGIRGRVIGGRLLSRSGLPIPNLFIRSKLEVPELEGCDGEIVCLPSGATQVSEMGAFQMTTSGVMSSSGTPNFRFCVFDTIPAASGAGATAASLPQLPLTFYRRQLSAASRVEYHVGVCDSLGPYACFWPTVRFTTIEQLAAMEKDALDRNFEGLIIRDMYGMYKYGRSTKSEGGMGKLKRFVDSEARILAVHPLEHNTNEQEQSPLGFAKRSSAKAGQVQSTTMMGRMDVQDLYNPNWTFSLGCGLGLDFSLRERIWKERDRLVQRGAIVKYKYQPHGVKDAPRSGIMLGFRDERDLG